MHCMCIYMYTVILEQPVWDSTGSMSPGYSSACLTLIHQVKPSAHRREAEAK